MKNSNTLMVRAAAILLALGTVLAVCPTANAQDYDWENDPDYWTRTMQKLGPDHVFLFNRGNAYYNRGMYDQAIADYTAAMKYDTRGVVTVGGGDAQGSTYRSRGQAYYAKGWYDQAIADYNAALRIDPNDAKAYYSRGNAYYMKRLYDQAVADYTAALRIDPNHALAREWLQNARKARGY